MITRNEIVSAHKRICTLATSKNLKEALELLETLVRQASLGEYRDRLTEFNETYKNILLYTVRGINDPQRARVYQHLLKSVLMLTDEVKETLLEQSGIQIYRFKKNVIRLPERLQKLIPELLDHHQSNAEVSDLLGDIPVATDDPDVHESLVLEELFRNLWLKDKFTGPDCSSIMALINEPECPWYNKSVVVSGITMGLMHCFDEAKLQLLLDIYDTEIMQVSERALLGAIVSMYLYDNRLSLYPAVAARLKTYSDNSLMAEDFLTVTKQLTRARDTEKISKRLREEIMPDILKLQSKLEDKLDLNNIISDQEATDKNPDWQSFLEDSPELMGKLEELSRLQLEGTDVFMTTFAMLKHFPFFNEIHNWFLPFFGNHPEVARALRAEDEKFSSVFTEALASSTYICNSDKYSFCLNVEALPENQKEMLLTMFNAELESMNEVGSEDEILNKSLKHYSVFTQYIQDMYRFFKLHPLHSEFDDLFDNMFDFHNKWFFKQLVNPDDMLQKSGNFYFENNHFDEALEVFTLLAADGRADAELFQKTGYCHQKNDDYTKALEFYLKSELFESGRTWLTKKIAYCYTRTGNFKKALEYYREAEMAEPSNINLQISIANCFLHMKDFKSALNYYYKVELQSPGNSKVLRPIAWCLFVNGKFAEAESYYNRLAENETPNRYDFMNIGHLKWCSGSKEEAINMYVNSIRETDNSRESFLKAFEDDTEYLLRNGIDPDDIPIMLDYLKYALHE
ncbi:MAG: tetratricopeptide repeat protein [Bacteroidota bacterium]